MELEENKTNDQKYRIQLGSRRQEVNMKKPGSKPVLGPAFLTKNSTLRWDF
jgi:hypothetical protein